MMQFMKRLARGFRREDGTASIEFVMAVHVLMTIFMASFESGLLMTRSIMIEQAVDISIRELRLGHMTLPNAVKLKKEICRHTSIIKDCEANTVVELTRISASTWAFPSAAVGCITRDEDILIPDDKFTSPLPNDLMLVRVCVRQKMMFPTSSFGMKVASDSTGGYSLVVASAFAVEPN